MNRLGFLFEEAFTNMRRNPMVVSGAVLAVFVSLFLAFGALAVQELVGTNTEQWQDGTHVIVFLKDARDGISLDAQVALRSEIDAWDLVESTEYVDKLGAFEEFKQLFPNSPVVDNIDPDVLPASIRVRLDDSTRYREVVFNLIDQPAVLEVVAPGESIENISQLSSVLNWLGFGLATVQGIAAVVLISNTIRMAIYARREEVSIMRLVGASNWFIRIPFLIEGMVEGVVGAGLAVFGIWIATRVIGDVDAAVSLFDFTLSSGFFVTWSILFIGFGALAGIVGSGLGLRRFLKV